MRTDIAERDVIMLYPMLATGGSASAAITFVKEYGVKNIKLMNILAAPEGIIAGSGRTTRMWRSTSPPWMKSSMTTATSSPVWGTPVTGFFRHQVRAPTWGLSRLWRDPRKILKSRKKRLTVSYPCDIISLALNEAAKQKALSQGEENRCASGGIGRLARFRF